MKKVLLIAAVFFAALYITSCKKESSPIIAPNGRLVSNSMGELTTNIANSLDLTEGKLSIEKINFADVPNGFIAEVYVKLDDETQSNKVLYMSNDLVEKWHFQNLNLGNTLKRRSLSLEATTVSCGCGGSSFPSSECEPHYNLNTGEASCVTQGCSSGCVMSIN